MVAIIGIILTVTVGALLEVPSLLRKKMKKELRIYAILLVVSTTLSILLAAHVKLPNPLDWIIAIYKPVSDAVLKLLS
jgi:hypothetical protein